MTEWLDHIDKEKQASLASRKIPAGEVLFFQGDIGENMYYVQRGRLEVWVSDPGGAMRRVGEIERGEIVGEMQLLTGGTRTATVKALSDTELLELPTDVIANLATTGSSEYHQIEQLILKRSRRNYLIALLPDLFGGLDETVMKKLESLLEWIYVRQGECLVRENDEADAMFIVVSGRLQVFTMEEIGKEKALLEIGRRETVGEMALFTDDPRSASVYALRDSVLVKIHRSVFYEVLKNHPKLHEHVTRVVMRRLQAATSPKGSRLAVNNITVIPLHRDVPVKSFVGRLVDALAPFGSTLRLSRAVVVDQLGLPESADETNPFTHLQISGWIEEQERQHQFIIFEADPEPSAWAQRTIQHADRILLVGRRDGAPLRTDLETRFLTHAAAKQQLFILLHPDDATMPSDTRAWLDQRRVGGHFHVRESSQSDYERLARNLAGHSRGLVLGGGGARGFVHIGIIQALREIGMPIDWVGGSSMGAVIASLGAMELDCEEMLVRSRRAFVTERPFRKHWLPVYSIFQDKKLDEVMHQIMYQDHWIEDLWLPCFVVSCSLGTSEMVVHEKGKVWEAVRASTALPGIVAPVSDGSRLHVDGGLMNNLPVDLMRARMNGQIIAVEASDMTDLDAKGLAVPSLREYFQSKWFSRQALRYPNIMEILMRSLMLGSTQNVKRAQQEADLLLKPPIKNFGLLEFDAIDEIVQTGYRYALVELKEWRKSSHT